MDIEKQSIQWAKSTENRI